MSAFRESPSSPVRAVTAFVVLLALLVTMLALSPSAGAGGSVGTPMYTVTVTTAGSGTGSVSSEPAGILCPSGACAVDFALGNPVTLVAEPSPDSRFIGWGGSVKGRSTSVILTGPSDNQPVEVQATFEKVARPVVRLLGKSLRGKRLPRKLRLRLDCKSAVPCRLRVTTFLGAWFPKRGYDYYRASSSVYSSRKSGKSYWNVAIGLGKATPLFYKRLNRSAARRGAVRIVVRDLSTGLGMAINQKGINEKGL